MISIYETFSSNKMLYNHELDENILKSFIKRNIPPTDPKKN